MIIFYYGGFNKNTAEISVVQKHLLDRTSTKSLFLSYKGFRSSSLDQIFQSLMESHF